MRRLALLALAACASRPDGAPRAAAAPSPPRVTPAATASLWHQDPSALFGNRRARTIGDILTVIVEIDDEAEMGRDMSRTRSNNQSFGIGALFGLPGAAAGRLGGDAGIEEAVELSRNQAQAGGGSARREDRVTLRLAARVTGELPNGDLVIDGRQQVRVGYETRLLYATGIVRPEDISRANTVTHDKIAEADIGYVGQGAIDRATRGRLGDRVLDTVIPF